MRCVETRSAMTIKELAREREQPLWKVLEKHPSGIELIEGPLSPGLFLTEGDPITAVSLA